MYSLTEQAQRFIAEGLKPGSAVIDATAGNGHDLVFLATATGPGGMVLGFDIQEQAIQLSQKRVSLTNAGGHIQLILADHAEMMRFIPDEIHGNISAIMFNLGYLPGGDHSITTVTQSTLQGLNIALKVLATRGKISVVCYPGHSEGRSESRAVLSWFNNIDPQKYLTNKRESNQPDASTPFLLQIEKLT